MKDYFKRYLRMILLTLLSFRAVAEGHQGAYLGYNFGLINKTSNKGSETRGSGFSTRFYVGLAHQHKKWDLDLEMGYRIDKIIHNILNIQTNSFSLDLNARRFELMPMLTIGPKLTLLKGEDMSYSDVVGGVQGKSIALFAGVSLKYDLREMKRKLPFRIDLSATTDLNIGSRQVSSITLGVNWFPPFLSRKIEAVEIEEVKSPAVEVMAKRPAREGIKFDLKSIGINFEVARWDLDQRAKSIFKNIASVLQIYSDEWQNVTVNGHTDKMGEDDENLVLSQKRADAVKLILMANGLQEERVETKGFGSAMPLIDEVSVEAYSKNRRVEFNIITKSASQDSLDTIDAILEKYK